MPDTIRYAPLIFDRLTPVYDLFVRLLLRDKALKHALVAGSHVAPAAKVLDIGVGTGTLAIAIKQMQPKASVSGLDGNPRVVAIAGAKSRRAGVHVSFHVGDAAALPYHDESFDRVLSSLVFSLLGREDKQRAAREAYRVLTGGGELKIADFGPPRTWWGRLFARRMRRFEPIIDNLDGCLPVMFRNAGFADLEEVAHLETVLGTLSLLSGRKPN